MSHIPSFQSTSPSATLVDFIGEMTQEVGHLSYADLQIISSWCRLVDGEIDEILIILADILPPWIGKSSRLSLAPVDKLLRQRLQEAHR